MWWMPSSLIPFLTFAYSRKSQPDLPLALPNLLDANLDRIAEPVDPSTPAPDELRLELVELVEVAGQPPRRNHSLEDVSEADEEPRPDHPGDLAGERRLPPTLEEDVVEEPRETDVVRAVFDLGRGPLPERRVFRGVVELLGHGIVVRAELPQQRAVHDEVGISADRRREVTVRDARETRVAEVLRVVARLLQRAQDERGERLAAAAAAGDVLADAIARCGCDLGRLAR